MTSNKPFLKVLFLLAIISASFWVLSFFPDLVMTLIVSGLTAFILKPIVVFLEFRLGMRRSLAIAAVFLLVGGATVLLAIQVVPVLIDRAQSMYDGFKTFPFDEKLNETARKLSASIPFIDANSVSQKVHTVIEAGLKLVGDGLASAAGFAVNLAIVPFITYFVLAEGDSALEWIVQRVPNKYFEMTLNVFYKIRRDLVGYLRGWILDSVIIGILSIFGYQIIGIDYAILIGIVAGIANLVPYLGPIVGAVPAFLVSLTQYGDFQKVLPIIILTFSVQLIDNTIVQPLCFSKTVDMHPVTVIFVLIIGNTLMGVAGMLLAIPLATILKASATETYWGLKNYQITA